MMSASALLSAFILSAQICALALSTKETRVDSTSLVTKTIWSTSPQVTLSPETSCRRVLGSCQRYMTWEKKIYQSDIDGKNYTYHLTNNAKNDPTGEQITRMEFGSRGAHEICVFGAPPSQLQSPLGSQEICLDSQCTAIDILKIYNSTERHDPARLWCSGPIDPGLFHNVQLRVSDSMAKSQKVAKDVSFHHLEYTAEEDPPRPIYSLDRGLKLVNTTIHSTYSGISYSPAFYMHDKSKHDPWDQEIYINELGQNATFYRTSNWLNEPGDNTRRAAIRFSGVAVYVYGAPPVEIRRQGQNGFGKVEVVLDQLRVPIDLDQIYLNIDHTLDRREVLIYSHDGLDPRGSYYLQLGLLDGTSQMENAVKAMTLARVDVAEVKPDVPVIQGEKKYRHAGVEVTEMSLVSTLCRQSNCTASPWITRSYLQNGGPERKFASLSTEGSPGAEGGSAVAEFYINGKTTSFRLLGPPRRQLRHIPAKQKVTISDYGYYYLDVEQAYLHIDPDKEDDLVELFFIDQLPTTFFGHRLVSLELFEGFANPSFQAPKEMVIQRAEYRWEETLIPAWMILSMVFGTLGLAVIINRNAVVRERFQMIFQAVLHSLLSSVQPHNTYELLPTELGPDSQSSPTHPSPLPGSQLSTVLFPSNSHPSQTPLSSGSRSNGNYLLSPTGSDSLPLPPSHNENPPNSEPNSPTSAPYLFPHTLPDSNNHSE